MTFTRVQKLPTAVGQATDMGNNIALGTVMFVVNCVIESERVARKSGRNPGKLLFLLAT